MANVRNHPLYAVWCDMRRRCRSPKDPGYQHYGGRGISVCKEWNESFHKFVADMGPRPAGYVIDRINNDGNYEPGNCRWTTVLENARNRRYPRRMKQTAEKMHAAWKRLARQIRREKTVFKCGHPYVPANIYWRPKHRSNYCKQCRNESTNAAHKRRRARLRDAHLSAPL